MLTIQDLMRVRHLTSEDEPAKFSVGSQKPMTQLGHPAGIATSGG